ncbi:uncharacterized protein Z518_05649 [Rhinocladiella mackenziei CBS 650.93]|uniref:Rhinocladiella mackenziei CBS 650.93 unplaced genomic scaffold supercont1.4, whole genome shotgun sequence n=1 Tax=Rhinocladiella mackenziei CBS 650.93 TaxID=1442369 RepID=A0A0D2IG58_9EURO|nr:uncharacterized protein Z518_05649 [Rhinocladiella mackenziei CBS 650.93]KIX04779.1 hypothetical protein Z518_05649 [Rhinocladiella mackenziei CBS 650.93]
MGHLMVMRLKIIKSPLTPRDIQSEASIQDPTWLPSDRSHPKDKRKRNTTLTESVLGAQLTKRIRRPNLPAQKVARKGFEIGTSDYEQLQGLYHNMMQWSTVSETVAFSQSAQEQAPAPVVVENPTLLYREESLQFVSFDQKARALEVVIREIEGGYRKRLESLRKDDLKYFVYSDTCEDTIFSHIFDKLEETCTRQSSISRKNGHSSETANLNTTVDYDGKRWEFKSVQKKAETLGTALGEVVEAIVKWIDLIKQVDVGQRTDRVKRSEERKLPRYFAGDFLPRIRLSLQENGARALR